MGIAIIIGYVLPTGGSVGGESVWLWPWPWEPLFSPASALDLVWFGLPVAGGLAIAGACARGCKLRSGLLVSAAALIIGAWLVTHTPVGLPDLSGYGFLANWPTGYLVGWIAPAVGVACLATGSHLIARGECGRGSRRLAFFGGTCLLIYVLLILIDAIPIFGFLFGVPSDAPGPWRVALPGAILVGALGVAQWRTAHPTAAWIASRMLAGATVIWPLLVVWVQAEERSHWPTPLAGHVTAGLRWSAWFLTPCVLLAISFTELAESKRQSSGAP